MALMRNWPIFAYMESICKSYDSCLYVTYILFSYIFSCCL